MLWYCWCRGTYDLWEEISGSIKCPIIEWMTFPPRLWYRSVVIHMSLWWNVLEKSCPAVEKILQPWTTFYGKFPTGVFNLCNLILSGFTDTDGDCLCLFLQPLTTHPLVYFMVLESILISWENRCSLHLPAQVWLHGSFFHLLSGFYLL